MEDSNLDVSTSVLEDSTADVTNDLSCDVSVSLDQSGSDDLPSGKPPKKRKGKQRRTPNKKHKEFLKSMAAKQDRYRTMNSFLNSSVTKRSLRNNNRELARGLQMKKRELYSATQTILDLQHENQTQRMRLAMLERLAGATNESIEEEVVKRMEEKLTLLKTSLTDVKFQLLDTVTSISQALEICDSVSTRSSLSNSALSNQNSALTTPESLPNHHTDPPSDQGSSQPAVRRVAMAAVPMATRTLCDVAQRLGPSVQEMSMILEQSCLQDFDLPFTDEPDEEEEGIAKGKEKGCSHKKGSFQKEKRSKSNDRRSALIFIPASKEDDSKDSSLNQDEAKEEAASKVESSKAKEKLRSRHRSAGAVESTSDSNTIRSTRLRSRSITIGTSVETLGAPVKSNQSDDKTPFEDKSTAPNIAVTRRMTRRTSCALMAKTVPPASEDDKTSIEEVNSNIVDSEPNKEAKEQEPSESLESAPDQTAEEKADDQNEGELPWEAMETEAAAIAEALLSGKESQQEVSDDKEALVDQLEEEDDETIMYSLAKASAAKPKEKHREEEKTTEKQGEEETPADMQGEEEKLSEKKVRKSRRGTFVMSAEADEPAPTELAATEKEKRDAKCQQTEKEKVKKKPVRTRKGTFVLEAEEAETKKENQSGAKEEFAKPKSPQLQVKRRSKSRRGTFVVKESLQTDSLPDDKKPDKKVREMRRTMVISSKAADNCKNNEEDTEVPQDILETMEQEVQPVVNSQKSLLEKTNLEVEDMELTEVVDSTKLQKFPVPEFIIEANRKSNASEKIDQLMRESEEEKHSSTDDDKVIDNQSEVPEEISNSRLPKSTCANVMPVFKKPALKAKAEDSSQSDSSSDEAGGGKKKPFMAFMAKPGRITFTAGRRDMQDLVTGVKPKKSRSKSRSTLPKPVRARSKAGKPNCMPPAMVAKLQKDAEKVKEYFDKEKSQKSVFDLSNISMNESVIDPVTKKGGPLKEAEAKAADSGSSKQGFLLRIGNVGKGAPPVITDSPHGIMLVLGNGKRTKPRSKQKSVHYPKRCTETINITAVCDDDGAIDPTSTPPKENTSEDSDLAVNREAAGHTPVKRPPKSVTSGETVVIPESPYVLLEKLSEPEHISQEAAVADQKNTPEQQVKESKSTEEANTTEKSEAADNPAVADDSGKQTKKRSWENIVKEASEPRPSPKAKKPKAGSPTRLQLLKARLQKIACADEDHPQDNGEAPSGESSTASSRESPKDQTRGSENKEKKKLKQELMKKVLTEDLSSDDEVYAKKEKRSKSTMSKDKSNELEAEDAKVKDKGRTSSKCISSGTKSDKDTESASKTQKKSKNKLKLSKKENKSELKEEAPPPHDIAVLDTDKENLGKSESCTDVEERKNSVLLSLDNEKNTDLEDVDAKVKTERNKSRGQGRSSSTDIQPRDSLANEGSEDTGRRSRRAANAVSYKEPSLTKKMRREPTVNLKNYNPVQDCKTK